MRLWVTGYRSYELGIFQPDDEKIKVIQYSLKKNLIEKFDDGLEWLITGSQLGVEQWAADTGITMKKDYPELKVAMMDPFQNMGERWKPDKKIRLAQLKEKADYSNSISNQGYQSPQQLIAYQHFMFSHTEQCLMVYDPEYPGKTKYDYEFIQRQVEKENTKDYELTLIDMYDLQDAAREYEEEKKSDY